jgi:hypothetical protein
MNMSIERLAVRSEIRELEELIASIPVNNVIDRMSLEARLQSAQERLNALQEIKEAPAIQPNFE